MRRRKYLILLLVFSATLLAGCSGSNSNTIINMTPPEPTGFLDTKSDLITAQGKKDFESLVLFKDDFTKDVYYVLPEEEHDKFKRNIFQFEFYLFKESDSIEFKPTFTISYFGDNFLLIKNAIFKVDDDVSDFFPVVSPSRTVLDNNVVREYLIFRISKEQVNFLSKSQSTADLDIRVYTKIYQETKLTSAEHKAMKKILSAYRYLISLP